MVSCYTLSMDTKNDSPKTLMEAVKYFSNLDVCHAYMVKMKWPDGVICCPKCGATNVGIIASRNMFQCKNKECRKQFSAKVDTIFEDSALGLDKWFVAVWCITSAKNGISSCELARCIGVTQKSAWHMLHRIRLAMKSGSFKKAGGTVEADEAHIGGKVGNFKKSKLMELKREAKALKPGKPAHLGRVVKKAIIMGILERGQNGKPSQMRTEMIESHRRPHIQDVVRKNVETGSNLMTDALSSYQGLGADFVHQSVNHAIRYALGNIHTNGVENFWSLLQRMLLGTYVAVEPFHLERYLDEQCFRFNHRQDNDAQRFARAMAGVVGKRLMYSELTGNAGQTQPS